MAWSLPERAVLGIFGKKAVPGHVKTRLAAVYGDDVAAELHEAMLLDLLATWGSAALVSRGGRCVLAYAPAEAGPWFQARIPQSFAVRPQANGDLGRRIRAFFESEFAEGASRVVLIGSDAPTLDPALVITAFGCLEDRDVVLGPATDGGYYLVGSRRGTPPLFDGIAWSTANVLAQTLDRLTNSGLSLALLPPWYDVDTADDLHMLSGHLRALRYSGVEICAARTEAVVARLMRWMPM